MPLARKVCAECNTRKPVTLFQGQYCIDCLAVARHKQHEQDLKEKRERVEENKVDPAARRAIEQSKAKAQVQAQPPKPKEQTSDQIKAIRKKKLAAQKLLAERELARRRLLPFVQYFNDDYEPGWVHEDIAARLEQFAEDVKNKKSPRLMLFLPPRHGKQLADSTPVLTTEGWKTHGELNVGDYVFHPSGKPVRVLAVSDKTPSDYLVELTNGDTIRCHGNHEWTVYDRAYKTYKTRNTEWFTSKTKFKKQRQITPGNRCMYQLPDIETLEFADRAQIVPPYSLGAWLGDGSRGKGCISHDVNDGAIIGRIEKDGYEVTSVCEHKDTGVITTYFSGPRPNVIGKFPKGLRDIGVYQDKHIPEQYIYASVSQRLELLAGLIDTDGHVCQKTGRVRFTSADKKLADGVYELCTTLGFRPYVTVEQPKLSSSGIQGRKEYYVVGFQPTLSIPTALPRKQCKIQAVRRKYGVKSVTYSPNGEQGHCIQVDSEDGLYLAGRNLTPTHNSELASKTFPAWFLGHYPKNEVIATSYSAELAMDFSRKVRGLIKDPEYQHIFPTKLDQSSQSAERWNTNQGGGYVAAGVGGSITGRGSHLAIIDDPIKNREDAESATGRQKIKDWYTSTLYTRLAPGGGILVILTRWHDDDLAGWLLEQEKEGADAWDVVKYPAIAEEDETHRKKGEPLHPERYPAEALERIRRAVGPRDWSALYQQDPVPDTGSYFKTDWFKYYTVADRPPLEELRIYQAWDFAIGQDETNDWTVGVTLGVDRDGNSYVLNTVRGHWDSFEIVEQMLEQARMWKPALVGGESGQIEMAIGPLLKKRMRETKTYFPIERLKTGKRDKQLRARPLQGRMQQGLVLLPANTTWALTLQNEMLRFPAGTHDDQVDALAWCFQMLESFSYVVKPKEKPKKSWRDSLTKYTKSGKRGSHMTA